MIYEKENRDYEIFFFKKGTVKPAEFIDLKENNWEAKRINDNAAHMFYEKYYVLERGTIIENPDGTFDIKSGVIYMDNNHKPFMAALHDINNHKFMEMIEKVPFIIGGK